MNFFYSLSFSSFFLGNMQNIVTTSESSKPEEVQQKSVNIANTYHCQTGILTPFDLFEHALYIIRMY